MHYTNYPHSRKLLIQPYLLSVCSLLDLEAEFLHSVIPPPPIIPTPTPPTTLLAMFPTPITAETRISENISNVLEHLPDFSYLRKSILAFPIQDQTE